MVAKTEVTPSGRVVLTDGVTEEERVALRALQKRVEALSSSRSFSYLMSTSAADEAEEVQVIKELQAWNPALLTLGDAGTWFKDNAGIIGTLGGAVVGAVVGGPVGATVGATVGKAVADVAVPPAAAEAGAGAAVAAPSGTITGGVPIGLAAKGVQITVEVDGYRTLTVKGTVGGEAFEKTYETPEKRYGFLQWLAKQL